MAEEFGENPETILAEIEHDPPTPAGRFILKLMRFATPEVRRGRPRHGSTPKTLARDEAIFRVVEDLLQEGQTLAQAYTKAPARLARKTKQDIAVHRKTVVRAYRRHREALFARLWFEPPAE